MVRKLFFILMLLIPLALAVRTVDITIVTIPNQEVTINVLNPVTSDLIREFVITNSSDGRYSASFDSNEGEVALYIIVRDANGRIVKDANGNVKYGRYGNYSTASPIYLELDQQVSPTLENTAENTTNTTVAETPVENITQENVTGTGVTGLSVFKISDIPKAVYYVFGAVVLIVILGFVAMKIIPKINIPENIVVRKQSDMQASSREKDELEREYLEAEKKLKEAKAEISKITNRDKIKEAERKLESDRQELEKLKKGF